MAGLPDEPSFEQLRNQAKDLRRAVLAGEADALAEVAERVGDVPGPFPLHTAQLAVARRYGFPSWTRLKRHVEVVERYSRFPDRMPGDGPAGLADDFLRLVSLYAADDEPERWAEGRRLLAEHPEITQDSVHAAAAAADTEALRRILAADPAAARHEGGPFRWPPLLYLTNARHDPQIGEDTVLTSARLLLDAGADPNAGYLWHGLAPPFTALTGVFGEGELGPVRQPRHPHSLALARLLLEAGADPNDGQALYNRTFEAGNDHLELLFEFGLGTGDGGPWRRRLGDAADTPAEMLRDQLVWAIAHGMTERVRLLVSHGADLTTPFEGGATATSLAATTGHADLVDYLVAHGAPPLGLDPADAFIAAVLAADRTTLDQLRGEHPGLADQVRSARPALITWAAACGRPEPVQILVALGFDVNAKGRTDMPSDQPWQTALHHAAGDGNLELAQTLLRLGADPDLRDHRFDSTPLGWARHFGQQPLIDLLEPITAPQDASQPTTSDPHAGPVVTIRPADHGDVDALRRIAAAAYQPHVARIGRAPAPMAADYAQAVRSGQAWVAVRDGQITGFAVLVAHPGYLLLENVAVLPAAQGRGIGGRLLGLAEQHARSLGLSEIRLYTNEAMTENLAYYPRHGYTETHRAEQDGFRRVFFRKLLT